MTSRATISSSPADPPAGAGPPANLLPRDGEALLLPGVLPPAEADRALARLLAKADWRQEVATLFGRKVALPRLTAWYGDAAYGYSGIRHEPAPWTPAILALKAAAEAVANTRFNSVLINLYRDGNDSMGWHSDDEPTLGPEPLIASLSLGAERRFQLLHRRTGDRVSVDLPHGSILIMKGRCQACWRHQLPKTKKPVSPRVNLTFRSVGGLA